jgi:hypothetical protein
VTAFVTKYPDLHELIWLSGGYDKISHADWEEYDRRVQEYRDTYRDWVLMRGQI